MNIDVNGTTLHSSQEGSGPDLVFVHGMWRCAACEMTPGYLYATAALVGPASGTISVCVKPTPLHQESNCSPV